MKKILITLTIILMMGACGKNEPILEERMDNGIVKIYDAANREYFTGYVENTKINKNGVKYTSEKGNVKNGIKDGEYTTYWDNGKVSSKETYLNGILNGGSSKYNFYGDLLEDTVYVNGEIEGPIIKIDFYKQKKIVGTIKNNIYIGDYKEYFLDGKLYITLTYNEKGRAEGIYTMYDSNGNILERAEYKDGLLYEFREDNLSSKESNLEKIIIKLKKGELGYKSFAIEENEDYLKMQFVVNKKVLHYAIYKNKKSYDKDLNSFLNDDFFIHRNEEVFDKKYKLIMLDPIIASQVYGKWYTLVGENQIIKASGDDYGSAEININEFYNRLKKLEK